MGAPDGLAYAAQTGPTLPNLGTLLAAPNLALCTVGMTLAKVDMSTIRRAPQSGRLYEEVKGESVFLCRNRTKKAKNISRLFQV